MHAGQIVLLGLVTTLLAVVLRQTKPELALELGLATGIVLFLGILPQLHTLVGFIRELAGRARVDLVYLGVILRIIGVAYLISFGAQVCRDAGEGAIAAKVEFAGKVVLMLMAMPLVSALLETVLRLLQ